MLKNENIICVSTMNWDFLWTRKQRFMDMLAKKGNRILYVEPTFSVAAKVRQGGTSLKVGFWPRLSQVRGNLYVLTPSLMFPFARFKCIRDINQRIFIWQVRWAQKKLNLRRPILWTYVPVYHKLAGKFFEKLFIYDCVDEHSAYPAAKKELLKVLEEKIIKTADVVFVTSWRLYEKKKLLNKNTFYVPNGVDFEFFRDVLTNKRVPKDMMAIKGPVIGWIGGVRSWLDFDLIEYIAETNPQWSIVFVGPVTEKVNLEPLQKLKNVFFLGEKAKEEIPVYLQNFDVCLIPNKINELTNAMNPIKIYEYLAVGKPVVAVNLEEVRQLADVVKIANDKEEFVALIKDSLYRDDREQILKRIQKAKNYSWEKLLDGLIKHVEENEKFKRGE